MTEGHSGIRPECSWEPGERREREEIGGRRKGGELQFGGLCQAEN